MFLLLASVSGALASTVGLSNAQQDGPQRLEVGIHLQQDVSTTAIQWRLEYSGVHLISIDVEKISDSSTTRRLECVTVVAGVSCLTYDPNNALVGPGTFARVTLVQSGSEDWGNMMLRLTGVRAATHDGDPQQINSSTPWISAGGGNRPPEAEDTTVVTRSGVPTQVRLTALDPDGDPLTFSITQGVTHGTLDQTGADTVYRSEAGYIGVDRFRYLATDGQGGQSDAQVTIFVEAGAPDPPEEASGPVIEVEGYYSLSLGQTLRFTVGVHPGTAAAIAWLSATSLPNGASFDAPTGLFVWTPIRVGTYSATFLAVNDRQETASRSVHIAVGPGRERSALANAATFGTHAPCSPGALASLFNAQSSGDGGAYEQATAFPLPQTLHGLRLRVNGKTVPLLYASDTQINFQCPGDEPGTTLEFVVEGTNWQTEDIVSQMSWASPGIFTLDGSGGGQGVIAHAGSGLIAMMPGGNLPGQPVHPEDYIAVYATGLGPLENVLAAGEAASLTELNPTKGPVRVSVGGLEAEVMFAGLAPGFAGLYQINARLPGVTQFGAEVPLRIEVQLPDGSTVVSNVVTFAIAPRPIARH